jgi:hypothetical protein
MIAQFECILLQINDLRRLNGNPASATGLGESVNPTDGHTSPFALIQLILSELQWTNRVSTLPTRCRDA